MQTEIGGYLELERFSGTLLHEKALKLSSGRACLAYLIQQRGIRKILLPDFLCDAVRKTCEFYGVAVRTYEVGTDLRPVFFTKAGCPAGADGSGRTGEAKTAMGTALADAGRTAECDLVAPEADEWLYLVNFYGQLTENELKAYAERFPKLIVDNAQAYFAPALQEVDTLYTCRKFLGVADGGFLYTDAPQRTLPRDESHGRMGFVLGRFERPAGEFFAEASQNNDDLLFEPKQMSRLTENLLRATDEEKIRQVRTENFNRLHAALGERNLLSLRPAEGAYAYPLMLENGEETRRKLIARKIYVPTLWPNVLTEQPEDSTAVKLAREILPLPCDQRYGSEEMDAVIRAATEAEK